MQLQLIQFKITLLLSLLRLQYIIITQAFVSLILEKSTKKVKHFSVRWSNQEENKKIKKVVKYFTTATNNNKSTELDLVCVTL